jgi:acyl carrier protein
MGKCMSDKRLSADVHQRFRHPRCRTPESRPQSGRQNHDLIGHVGRLYLLITLPEPTGHPGGPRTSPTGAQIEADTLAILKRLGRKPIEPTPDRELLADLGFDSLLVLELVGELEDHFNISVPLNNLTHIRTVGQIVAEVQRLVAAEEHSA